MSSEHYAAITSYTIIRKPWTFPFLLSFHPTIHPFVYLFVCLSFHPSIHPSSQESLDVPSLICLFLFASSLITSFLYSLFPYFLSSFPVLLKNTMQLCKSLITLDVFYHSDVVSQLQKKRSTMPFPLTFQFCKYTYFLLVNVLYFMFYSFLVCVKLIELSVS